MGAGTSAPEESAHVVRKVRRAHVAVAAATASIQERKPGWPPYLLQTVHHVDICFRSSAVCEDARVLSQHQRRHLSLGCCFAETTKQVRNGAQREWSADETADQDEEIVDFIFIVSLVGSGYSHNWSQKLVCTGCAHGSVESSSLVLYPADIVPRDTHAGSAIFEHYGDDVEVGKVAQQEEKVAKVLQLSNDSLLMHVGAVRTYDCDHFADLERLAEAHGKPQCESLKSRPLEM
jgi:hypothetical protein